GHPGRWWSLTPPFHPYHTAGECTGPRGGLFSVALSRESLRVAVSNHPALRSPDFPRDSPSRDHPANSPAVLILLAAEMTAVVDQPHRGVAVGIELDDRHASQVEMQPIQQRRPHVQGHTQQRLDGRDMADENDGTPREFLEYLVAQLSGPVVHRVETLAPRRRHGRVAEPAAVQLRVTFRRLG